MSMHLSRNQKACEENIARCLFKYPELRILTRALEEHGCKLNLRRHLSCEDCVGGIMGGFDVETNQVVICMNNASTATDQCRTLVHELIHAFDKCRSKVDFSNLNHLACTEIRAAAFTKCSLSEALLHGYYNHRDCARNMALKAVLTVSNVTKATASQAVDNVFQQCYSDKEPFGRFFQSNKDRMNCLKENEHYGYARDYKDKTNDT